MRKQLIVFCAVLFSLCFMYSISCKEAGSLDAIEFLGGYYTADIKDNDRLISYPLAASFDFSLAPLASKIGIRHWGLLQFQIEPFAAFIAEPQDNFEFGNNFFLKIGAFSAAWKFQPFLKAGIGLDYMTLHTREQSTQFNFTEFGGAGFHYFLSEKIAFTSEYRFRHLSNASIKSPNKGINSRFVLLGLTYKY